MRRSILGLNCDNAVEPTPKAPTKRSRSESGHASGSSLAHSLPLALVSQSWGNTWLTRISSRLSRPTKSQVGFYAINYLIWQEMDNLVYGMDKEE